MTGRSLRRSLVLGLCGTLGTGAGYLAARLCLSKPRTSGKLRLPFLESAVEVVFDRSGMPHVYADSDLDGFRALGYVMGQERLVQIQLMLTLARGELSEIIGKPGLEMDRFLRTLGLRRIAEEAVSNLKPHSMEILNAFGEGLNYYASQGNVRLPFEFMLFKGRPRPWGPIDCMTSYLYVIWLLDTWWTSDILREKLIRNLGMERAMQLLPETSDINNPPHKVEGPGVSARTLEPGEEIDWGFESGSSGGSWVGEPGFGPGIGSNNWVVSGKKSTTGKPILASDPHLQHAAPSLLFLFHLKTPSYDAAGAGFPGLPAVAFGHNGYCGWAATNLDADTIDLYVETFESEESNRYLYEGEWKDARVIEEEVKVRFSKPRRLRIVVTEHGPIVRRKGNRGLALRWMSAEDQPDTLDAMLRQSRASSWEEFVAPMEDYLGPCSNQVYADVDGNIGYQATGRIPVRSKGDGTVPYHGQDGDCEWEGPIPLERMPRTLNREEGFIVTANSKATSEGYPELISREWNPPYRNARITEMLRAREKFSPEDMALIQGDVLTIPGRDFAKRMAEIEGELSPAAESARKRLLEWNCRAEEDSVAMTIYTYTWKHVREKVLRHRLGSSLYDEYRCNWTTVDLAVENILDAADGFWLPPSYDSFDRLLLDCLEESVEELSSLFEREEQSSWKWGRVHHLTLKNFIGMVWPLDRLLNIGPVPIEGDASTVHPSSPGYDSVVQVHAKGYAGGSMETQIFPAPDDPAAYGGPVLRMILDFSDLDNSRIVLDVGQSGHRLSKHYKDHFPLWKRVEYFPFPYSRDKVMENAESTLSLVP